MFYGHGMSAVKTVKTWEKTNQQNLVRHKSGRYYARLFLNGKELWKSLKTDSISVAKARLGQALKEHRERRARNVSATSANMTFQQAADLHLQRLDEKVSIKKRTRKYWRDILKAILKSWPELASKEVRRITEAACREWASGYSKQAGATRYNNSLAMLRHVLDVAVESGVLAVNVATDLVRKPVRPKKLELPTLEQFEEFVTEIRTAGGRDSKNCADLTEGLAYTGCRISESARVHLDDINLRKGEVRVLGDPEEATKNGEIRYVPMIPAARQLFERLKKERAGTTGTEPVFQVRECQKAMDRAANKIGMKRITHHDLRHFFATVCIESGVDIPTVSRWLGHKDGGVLAMKTYGHLRREHSQAQALKVSFRPSTAAPGLPQLA